jgi:hypothetical protein
MIMVMANLAYQAVCHTSQADPLHAHHLPIRPSMVISHVWPASDKYPLLLKYVFGHFNDTSVVQCQGAESTYDLSASCRNVSTSLVWCSRSASLVACFGALWDLIHTCTDLSIDPLCTILIEGVGGVFGRLCSPYISKDAMGRFRWRWLEYEWIICS